MGKDELCHHGIKGMKWGIRRYQNEDGTLTPEGKKRVNEIQKHPWKSAFKDAAKTMAVVSAIELTPVAIKTVKDLVHVNRIQPLSKLPKKTILEGAGRVAMKNLLISPTTIAGTAAAAAGGLYMAKREYDRKMLEGIADKQRVEKGYASLKKGRNQNGSKKK